MCFPRSAKPQWPSADRRPPYPRLLRQGDVVPAGVEPPGRAHPFRARAAGRAGCGRTHPRRRVQRPFVPRPSSSARRCPGTGPSRWPCGAAPPWITPASQSACVRVPGTQLPVFDRPGEARRAGRRLFGRRDLRPRVGVKERGRDVVRIEARNVREQGPGARFRRRTPGVRLPGRVRAPSAGGRTRP